MNRKIVSSPRVYSYIRFSTPEQAFGDSERRQLAEVEQFAKTEGMTLDSSLRMTDRGLSGFHGEHRRHGALGEFLKRVESGRVPPGSILCVENLDRLGRENVVVSLQKIIFALVEKGVVIQTLSPAQTYSLESINSHAIWQLIAHVQRAHAESERKSELVGKAWQNKRECAKRGIILTSRGPAWLRKEGDKFVVIPGAAKTIREIFRLKLKGLGKQGITRKLNGSAAWMPPYNPKRKTGGWRASYVVKILSYRAVLGEYQPYTGTHKLRNRKPVGDPIAGYYPQIVKRDVFFAVEKQLEGNRGRGGETAKARNLFTHLVCCAYCGGPMVLIDKGRPPKGRRYLICDQGRRAVRDEGGNVICKSYSISYDEVEAAVLENCIGLRPEQVLPNPDEQADEVTRLQTKLAGMVGQLEDLESRIASLVDAVETAASKEVRADLTARIEQRREEMASLNAKRTATKGSLESAERSRQSVEQWQRSLKDLRGSLAKGDVETRLRMRMHLRELIEKIEVFAVGFPKLSEGKSVTYPRRQIPRRRGKKRPTTEPSVVYEPERDVEALADHLIEVVRELDPDQLRSAEFKAFLKWVTSRRMSKAGRFLRIRFKTKIRRDIVPGNSIASGRGLEVDEDGGFGWTVKQPSLDRLWKQFLSFKPH